MLPLNEYSPDAIGRTTIPYKETRRKGFKQRLSHDFADVRDPSTMHRDSLVVDAPRGREQPIHDAVAHKLSHDLRQSSTTTVCLRNRIMTTQ